MGRKIKMIKKTADTYNEGESVRDFVSSKVEIKKEDYVLAVDEEEVTDNLDFLRAAKDIKKVDRKAFRSGLQRLDEIRGGASNMNPLEKQLVGATFSFANGADLLAEYPDVRDRINNGVHDFHSPAVESRRERFRYAASIIYNTVNEAAADTVIDKFTTPQTVNNISLWTAYTEFGKEGSAFGDADCYIMDFVRSTGAFLANGLSELITDNLQAVPNNLTVSEILDAIENVLIDGIYEIP